MKHRLLTLLAAWLFAAPAWASSPVGVPAGQATKLFYFEVNPGEQLKLEFSTGRACPNPVQFDRFESIVAHVRVIHLYAHASPTCANAPSGLTQMALNLGKESKVMTHVYLTADTSLGLRTR